MNRDRLIDWQKTFRAELLDNVIPFWMEHGWDRENGGVRTYLDRDGQPCSNVKSVWVQGRFMWMLSYLNNTYGENAEWMRAAESCRRFIEAHCFAPDKRMYFLVTDEGRPVRKRRYFFSETFYIIGLAEYAKATGDPECLQKARTLFDMVFRIYKDPASDTRQFYPKYEPQTLRARALGGPMIMLNVTSVMRRCDPGNAERYDAMVREYISDILTLHYHPEHKCLFENVGLGGTPDLKTPMGRLVNPGHAIEAAWFLLVESEYFKDADMRKKALDILSWSLELGWDKKHGGLFYFVDRLGYAPEQYEHDLKLWWPQNEACIAALLAYVQTGEEKWFDWFDTIARYSFRHFKDDPYPEWAGYLHHDNTKQLPVAKGNYFKGPFHLPRMLSYCDGLIDRLLRQDGPPAAGA